MCCVHAGTYTGAGNNGLSFAAFSAPVTMQSLAGELNTIIDLGGGSRAFSFATEPAGTTLSGLPACLYGVMHAYCAHLRSVSNSMPCLELLS